MPTGSKLQKNIPEWKRLANHDHILCSELRATYSFYGIALHALGIVGFTI